MWLASGRCVTTGSARLFNVRITVCSPLSILSRDICIPLSIVHNRGCMAKKDPAAVRLGRKGGQAAAKKRTAEEREEHARKAARARWGKRKQQPGSKG